MTPNWCYLLMWSEDSNADDDDDEEEVVGCGRSSSECLVVAEYLAD